MDFAFSLFGAEYFVPREGEIIFQKFGISVIIISPSSSEGPPDCRLGLFWRD